jgi:rhodanese-related sulfurtransferase
MANARHADDLLAAARSRLDRVAPAAAYREQAQGAILIDTRCEDDRRRAGTIPGSIAIPLSVLPWRLDPGSDHREPRVADRTRRIILVCSHGYSSSLAAATLLDLGFERATDIDGGFAAWVEAGLPVERPDDAPDDGSGSGLGHAKRDDEA